jgi:hypothetical protein
MALLGGWLPRRWIIQTANTVISPETPHWTDDGHRAHRDDVDGDHDHGAENNRDGVPDPPSTSAATLTMRYGGPGTPGGRRATPPR